MKRPIGYIGAQNLAVKNGQTQQSDIERHTIGWIRARQATFDGWIAQAQAQALAAAG